MAKLIKMVSKDFAKAVLIDRYSNVAAITVDSNRVTAWASQRILNEIRKMVIFDAVVEKEEARNMVNEIMRTERPHEFETLFEYLSWAKPCQDSKGRTYICGEDEHLCEEDGHVRICAEEGDEEEALLDPEE